MLILRPVMMNDHAALLALAKEAGIGMTSLPADADVLESKIGRAELSMAGSEEWKGLEAFLLVLEDSETGKPVGTTGIVAHVGLRNPFYSYKLSTIVQASKELGVYSSQQVLHMVNDYTGASEIGSLFLTKDYRRDGIGRFLSRARFLMMAEFPEYFSDVVISEIRGVQDEAGESPFYKNLAQHFFQMPFKKADFIHATQGGQFVTDLMPRYPIYVNLLDARAQAVIAQPHQLSLPAKQMLEAEGFTHQGYIDVFDAGPTLQANRATIRTVRKSRKLPVAEIKNIDGASTHMVGNTRFDHFRIAPAAIEIGKDGVAVDAALAEALRLSIGDPVRVAEL
ncbi:MAG: arginine N-succinyltransferase [Alphaproteobacteria bacterium]|nr:arginine N-succinyltransferase [Alphaproteobacteria bacterium]